jgi:hypothetical protein
MDFLYRHFGHRSMSRHLVSPDPISINEPSLSSALADVLLYDRYALHVHNPAWYNAPPHGIQTAVDIGQAHNFRSSSNLIILT